MQTPDQGHPTASAASRALILALALVAAALAGCETMREEEISSVAGWIVELSKARQKEKEAEAASTQPADDANDPALASGPSKPVKYAMSSEALDVWNDPNFQRDFAASYAAETALEPKLTDPEREQMTAVMELIQQDKGKEATAMLEKIVAGDAASATFDMTLGNLYFQQERLDEAAKAYRAAIEQHPKYRRAWKNLALIHVRRNDFGKALPSLTRVIELGGGDALTYGLLAFANATTGNTLAAESAYRMAILLDPGTLDWKKGLVQSFFRQGRYAEAVALCGQLIKQYPDRADLWAIQANAYVGMDKPMRAAENLELVDRMGKTTAANLNMLGDIYVNEELYDLAVGSYTRAMKKDADAKPGRAINAARVLASRGALDETRRLVEQIEQLRGDQLEIADRKDLLKLRARIAVAAGAGEEEARVLKEIVELDPMDGEALILLGQHASRGNKPEKAIFYFERAAQIDDYEADAKVRHAQVLVKQGKYREALPLLRAAQQKNYRENIQEYLEQVERVAKAA